ncbi:MAG: diguanylate cyclase [Rhodanobacter lindaniclasticus]
MAAPQCLPVCLAAIFLIANMAMAAPPRVAQPSRNTAQLLQQADGMESSNIVEFSSLLKRLDDSRKELTPAQQWHLRYLQARRIIFLGDFKNAIPLMEEVADGAQDPLLSFRARATTVDLLVTQSRYQDAFERLDPLLTMLPKVTDKKARVQALGVAAQLYLQAGQYDLAENYAQQLLRASTDAKGGCVARFYLLDALVRGGHAKAAEAQRRDGMDVCDKAGDVLIADMFKSVVARLDVQQGRPAAAVKLLLDNYAKVQRKRFPPAVADFDELLAMAYHKLGASDQAKRYALQVVSNNKSIGGVYSESTAVAYHILYEVEKSEGDTDAALAYHEEYMAADKGYVNDVTAKALAYQIVKQRLLAKKLQVEELDKKNKLLGMQGELDRKEVETSRLYILLLLLVLASIGLWAYRIKRSQLKFMKLARRDGLTGIFNRQHFVNEAERLLRYCQISGRDACLVLLDLDHFKQVNDNHGHAVGDCVLRRAVGACQKHLRTTDLFGRLGGEEFGMLLPECGREQVLERVEQMRLAVAQVPVGEAGSGVVVSASFGVASAASSGYELRQLMTDADDALYRAKREGRNRVSLANCRSVQPGHA